MENEENKTLGNGEVEVPITMKSWLDDEAENLKNNAFDGERLPALKLEENKIAELDIDFSEEFRSWTAEDGKVKKIIPVTFRGEKLVWWLNTKNPIYGKIIAKAKEGQTHFKVLQVGSQNKTTYTLIEDDQKTIPADSPKEVASIQG